MKFRTKIVQLKKCPKDTPISYGQKYTTNKNSVIATIPVGYADGYLRALSNRANVLIRGKRVPQVGIICMDLCMIDVTSIPDIKIDDEVILFGGEDENFISVEEIADWAETIPYEILCQVGKRVKRIYL